MTVPEPGTGKGGGRTHRQLMGYDLVYVLGTIVVLILIVFIIVLIVAIA
jgi:hypothetical protein